MEPVLTSAGMKALDRYAINVLGIPSIALMENAGRGVADAVCRHYGDPGGKSVVVFCGKGNNGGDGLVAARHLHGRRARLSIVMMTDPSQFKGDAKKNYRALKNIAQNASRDEITFYRWRSSRPPAKLPGPDIVIDAIFGTGFSGNVKGEHKSAIAWINSSGGAVVSIDIPSGLDADFGTVGNVAVRASLTVTMGYKKTGLVLNDGMTYAGLIEVIDISLPRSVRNRPVGEELLLDEESVRMWLPVRSPQAHKHSVGKVLIAAGSKGFTGAAALTSVAAMRSGAGSAMLSVPASVHPLLVRKLREVIVLPMPEDGDGSFSSDAFDALERHFPWADVVIAGPGLSVAEGPRRFVAKILERCELPLVLDADALNIIAENPRLLSRRRSKECILTPHMGEFSRLTGVGSAEIARKRISMASGFAKKYELTLVLKGAPTIIASDDGSVFINSTGNPGMATAGSGDVLGGMIAGLWAQGMGRVNAACATVYLHGLAGDLGSLRFGERGLMAGDILDNIPAAMMQVEGRSAS